MHVQECTAYRITGSSSARRGARWGSHVGSYLKEGITDDFFVKTQDDTFPTGINNATDIVGFGVYGTGFIANRIKPNGGVDKGGVITPEFLWLMHPDGISTFPFGINDGRVVVGTYMVESGALHGFVAAPGK